MVVFPSILEGFRCQRPPDLFSRCRCTPKFQICTPKIAAGKLRRREYQNLQFRAHSFFPKRYRSHLTGKKTPRSIEQDSMRRRAKNYCQREQNSECIRSATIFEDCGEYGPCKCIHFVPRSPLSPKTRWKSVQTVPNRI